MSRGGEESLAPDVAVYRTRHKTVAVTDSLARALIERAGLERREAEGCWLAPDGRRTSATAEALLWALVAIAEED